MRLTICSENLLLLHPLIVRLSTETAAFVSFRLLRRQSVCFRLHSDIHFCFSLLSFSLSASPLFTVTSRGLSFTHFCFVRRHLAIQSFTSPSCRRCRLLSHLLFCRRPLIHLLQLVIAIVGLPLVNFRFS